MSWPLNQTPADIDEDVETGVWGWVAFVLFALPVWLYFAWSLVEIFR